MGTVQAHGIAAGLPAGWDGRITATGTRVAALHARPVAHFANFGLPGERGDYGSGAVELMGDRDVLVVLFEFEPDATATALFATRGMPRSLGPGDFDPATLRRGIPGQSAHQAFFQEAGRAFGLYVVLGAHARRAHLVPLVNGVLASVRIDPAGRG
jgi:hypothetical protein